MINKNRVIDEFIELVAIDSPSFGEREIADVLIAKLQELGFSVSEDDAGKAYGSNCGNVYGFLEGELEGEPILFSAHMDTVPPALNKRAILQPDGRITSAGDTVLGADDIAGLISILEAVRSLKEEGIPYRSLEVMFTIAEEPYAKGSAAFDYSKVRSKEAYILDLSGKVGRAAYAAPTIVTFTATIQGKAAHAGFSPEEGIHSIAIAARIINQIKLGRIDEDTTVNIGRISGGAATNIIPETCRVDGEIRSFCHETAVKILSDLKELFLTETGQAGAALSWEEIINCHAFETDPEGKTAERYRMACEEAGLEAELVRTLGGSDCNTFATKGICGLVLSNAMNQVHSCNEYTEVEELVNSIRIVRNIMRSRS
jgi:tripeptide aminopeptidase